MNTKTIDINAKEYFDKVNGNSYFSGTITLNRGSHYEETFLMVFQYGYGSQYEHEAQKTLNQFNKISTDFTEYQNLQRYCRENNIKYNSTIEKDCTKKELKEIETIYNNMILYNSYKNNNKNITN